MKKVSCVIMDWAGTAVDFGCFAPLNAFLRVFQEQGVTITYRQAREPMGLLKIEHIKAILKMPEVSERFRTAHGREWNQNVCFTSGFYDSCSGSYRDNGTITS